MPLHEQHPQQTTFQFVHPGTTTSEETGETDTGDSITVSSEFDSGNMSHCKEIAPYSFEVQMSEDSKPYSAKGHYRTWFYFSVTGVPNGKTLRFCIKNMNN